MEMIRNEDGATAVGRFSLKLYGADGQLKDERQIKNVVTTAGLTALAARMAADTPSGKFMTYIGIGTGTTGALAADTTLETEASRKLGSVSSSMAVFTNTVTFNAGEGTGAITEAGLLSASSGGTLFSRQTFAAVNKAAADSLVVTWNVTLS